MQSRCKMILLGFHCVKLKMMESSKPLLKEYMIQVPVVDEEIIEATCSADSDGGSCVVVGFQATDRWRWSPVRPSLHLIQTICPVI